MLRKIKQKQFDVCAKFHQYHLKLYFWSIDRMICPAQLNEKKTNKNNGRRIPMALIKFAITKKSSCVIYYLRPPNG